MLSRGRFAVKVVVLEGPLDKNFTEQRQAQEQSSSSSSSSASSSSSCSSSFFFDFVSCLV